MSIAYEINRLNRNKQKVKEQVNVDKDIISEGREFIRDETVNHYSSGIKIMEMSYKDFIPVHTSTESLIETERGGTIIERRLMGNTTQDGTPTPSLPVAIKSVTGLQNFSICGKNLYDKNNVTSTGASNQNIKFTTTLLPNTQYTFNITSNRTWGTIYLYDSSNTQTRTIGNYSNANKLTFTTSASEVKGDFIFKADTNVDVSTYDFTGVQLERGSTATTYEPYQGKDYEINLGKNLLDEKTLRQGSGYDSTITNRVFFPSNYYLEPGTYTLYTNLDTTNYKYAVGIATKAYPNPVSYVHDIGWQTLDHVTFTLSQSGYLGVGVAKSDGTSSITPSDISNYHFMLCKGSYDSTTSYSPYFEPIELNKIGNYQDFIRKGTGKNLADTEKVNLGYTLDNDGSLFASPTRSTIFQVAVKPSTKYSLSVASNYQIGNIFYYKEDGTHLTTLGSNWGNNKAITTPSGAYYISFATKVSTDATMVESDLTNLHIQIEENSSTTYYEPYGYKDKWYIEKNIEKVVLNGSESYTRQVVTGDVTRFMHTLNVAGIGDARQTFISNYFVANLNYVNDREGVGFVYGDLLYLYKEDTTVANFQTWLSTHNTTVYYVLSSPTFETISDSTLIDQLNENIYLLEGQNNISVSGNLPTGIDVDYIERVNKHLIGNTNESAE